MSKCLSFCAYEAETSFYAAQAQQFPLQLVTDPVLGTYPTVTPWETDADTVFAGKLAFPLTGGKAPDSPEQSQKRRFGSTKGGRPHTSSQPGAPGGAPTPST